MSKEQREYLLRQQMRAIQQELGEKNPEKAEVDLLREQLEKADLPDDVRKEAERELGRLEKISGRRARPPRHPHLPRAGARAAVEQVSPRTTSTSLTRGRCSTRTTSA